ncbi:tetraacyldisaccharide 4'-kinase [Fontivita pretiosa]|uniref:tetraacyldisaccharide 4'-kinase n=1 Tax=Fontivita pretiosa TaxID=2989684 RepID=UPI003D177297
MPVASEQRYLELISGRTSGAAAALARAALAAAEPLYATVTTLRNVLYARGVLACYHLAQPVISVGNITTGGTGKTPVVRWLVQRLLEAGLHPAVLLRGYKGGDEARLLQEQLPAALIEANPSRVEAARHVQARSPDIDVFVLDDGFQHRRIRRDFDLVLIDASNPFGYGHVLPRGLLREPLRGLNRADAFLITHVELSSGEMLQHIQQTLRRYNAHAPIYRCRHVHADLRDAAGNVAPVESLSGRRIVSFCGIGNPDAFEQQLDRAGAVRVASLRFADHHQYELHDLVELTDRAADLHADMIVTTEKDWIKLRGLLEHAPQPEQRFAARVIWRIGLTIGFLNDDEAELLGQISRAARGLSSLSLPAAAPAEAAGA